MNTPTTPKAQKRETSPWNNLAPLTDGDFARLERIIGGQTAGKLQIPASTTIKPGRSKKP